MDQNYYDRSQNSKDEIMDESEIVESVIVEKTPNKDMLMVAKSRDLKEFESSAINDLTLNNNTNLIVASTSTMHKQNDMTQSIDLTEKNSMTLKSFPNKSNSQSKKFESENNSNYNLKYWQPFINKSSKLKIFIFY
jgi:hypothetical protein